MSDSRARPDERPSEGTHQDTDPTERTLEHFGLPAEVFFKAVEQAPVAISITDTRACVQYVNKTFEKVTGFSFDDVKGKNESVLSDRRTPGIVYESLWSALLRSRAWSGRLVNRRSNGERYLAELMVAPVLDASQTAIHYLGMHRDVSEEHTLEQAVLNQRALIDSLLDCAPMWFVALDERANVALGNAPFRHAAKEFCGEHLGRHLASALCGDTTSAYQELREKKAMVPEREIDVALSGDAGNRRIRLAGRWLDENDTSADAFFKSGGQRYFLIFGTDLTSLRKQEEEVRTNAMRALVAEEERAHELHEALEAALFRFQLPINLLSTALRSAERRGGDPLAHRTLVETVREAVKEGHELLERLSESVPETPKARIEAVHVSELINEALRLYTHRLIADDIVIDRAIPESLIVQGDPGRLRALFKELIDNAVEAMGSSAERAILIEARSLNERAYISISDTGPGIPEALQFKVFEPFFSQRGKKRDGAGMGLPRVQSIVLDHSGTVYVDSTYHRGCRITVELPQGDAPQNA